MADSSAAASSGNYSPLKDDSPRFAPPAALQEQQNGHHHPRALQRSVLPLTRKVSRAMFVAGLCAVIGRVLLGFSKSLMKGGLSKRFFTVAKRETLSTNPLKWGVLFAGLASFRLWQQLALRLRVPERYASFVGGMLASIPLNIMNVTTRTELALYLTVRASHGVASAHWSSLPSLIRAFPYWDVFAIAATAIPILYTAFFQIDAHAPSYQDFLIKNTMYDQLGPFCAAALARDQYVPEMIEAGKNHGINYVTSHCSSLASTCSSTAQAAVSQPLTTQFREVGHFLHPDCPSCVKFNLMFLPKHFLKYSLPLYLPLKITTTIVFGWKKAVKAPLAAIKKVLTGSFKSSMFLTLYSYSTIITACVFEHVNVHSTFWMPFIAGTLSSLPTVIEPKGRRVDLALYCAMHALRCSTVIAYRRGVIPRPTRQWILVMQTLAIATIFHQFDFSSSSMHPNLRSLFGWLLKEKQERPRPAVAPAAPEPLEMSEADPAMVTSQSKIGMDIASGLVLKQ